MCLFRQCYSDHRRPSRLNQILWTFVFRGSEVFDGGRVHGSASIHIDAESGYHSHPHSQHTEWLRWGLISSFLHAAHNLIHIFILPRSVRLIAIPESSRAARSEYAQQGNNVRPRTLGYFPTLPFTLPIPVQRSQPDLVEKPAVGPQKPLVMSLKSVVMARLL